MKYPERGFSGEVSSTLWTSRPSQVVAGGAWEETHSPVGYPSENSRARFSVCFRESNKEEDSPTLQLCRLLARDCRPLDKE